jgi:hypothetical protein
VRPVEPNPFAEATFVELQHACSEAITALQDRPFKTPADKAAFAKRLRWLLLAVAMRLRCGPTIPGSAEMALTESPHATVDGEFMPLFHRTAREQMEGTRNYILRRAADFVLERRSDLWLATDRRIHRVMRDDAALEELLRELDSLHRNR